MVNERRYDIDWIRVILFDILIVYHVGMFFVPWDWELKNSRTFEWLEWPMVFVNRWRLPILFVVSGMGTRLALSRKNVAQFTRERLKRLLIPLLAGILLIIPPQIYLHRLAEGQNFGSYFSFYPSFFNGVYPEGNFSWAHLWFLPYLLVMTIVGLPLFLYLRTDNNLIVRFLKKALFQTPLALFLFAIPLFMADVFLKPYFPITHALIDDWYALVHFFICFLFGFLFVSTGQVFWEAVKRIRIIALLTGIASFTLLILLHSENASIYISATLASVNRCSWILTIFGFAACYLNRESKVIKYRNQAVYPFYILHQTIIIIIGFYLMDSRMDSSVKAIIMITVTFGGCAILYEYVIRRSAVLRPLFGIIHNKR